MGKCGKCGRKGFFLITHEGLCKKCAVSELENLCTQLKDKDALFLKIEIEAKESAIKKATEELSDKVAEAERIVELNKEKASEAEARQIAALREEEKSIKNCQSIDKKLIKFKSLLSAIQNAVDMSATDYPIAPSEISRLAAEIEDLLVPSVTLELQCLGMRDLRKRYRANEKCIEDVLAKYKERYTTKANLTIYSLTVIALKAELQNILLGLKFGNLEKAIQQLKSVTQKYYLITADGNQSIAPTMRKFIGEIEYLFEQAIRIEYEYYVQKERAKEEQRAIREQMRQEAEERKALEAERKKVEKEEAKFTSQIDAVQEQLHSTEDQEKITQLEARLKELQEQKAMVEEKKEQIITLQNGKAGNVYIISNLGAFGDEVFKIGMTRRADPQDRVDELGNASVPFPFDVHSFIFSSDAVGLEGKLHTILNDRRVNKVNLRKEFFRIPIDDLERLVLEIDPTADFKTTMLAEQYRQSQSITCVSENPIDADDEDFA